MAQARKTRRRSIKKAKTTSPDLTNNIIGFILLLIAIFGLFRWGALGMLFTNAFRFIGGDTYFILAFFCLLYGGYLLIKGENPNIVRHYLVGFILGYLGLLLFLSTRIFNDWNIHGHFITTEMTYISADFSRLAVTEKIGGGILGALLYSGTYPLLSTMGSYFIAILILIIGIMVFLQIPFSTVISMLHKTAVTIGKGLEYLKKQTAPMGEKLKAQFKARKNSFQTKTKPQTKKAPIFDTPESQAEDFEIHTSKPTPESATVVPTTTDSVVQSVQSKTAKNEPGVFTSTKMTNYRLPGLDLLTPAPKVDQSRDYQAIKHNRGKLKATLASFGVDVEVKSASLGPTITKYEVQPAVGVKVSKIVNLADDLAMALAAKDIRIEAPIPGKPYVGIEVPNTEAAPVAFKSVISEQPKHPDKVLEVPLGKDVNGQIISADLTKMPHLLIAGSTGSGKSVAINTIITSILMRATPDQVRLMLVDPKMVELSVYNGIPHLLIPVVTDAKKAAGALNKAVKEMERRYQLFADNSVRNMSEYNQLASKKQAAGETAEILPYIVIVVDELSDLMMVAGNEVESAIVRLAQMARAAGMHMIIATQRPSVDVITGLIKANIPSRIAFAVSSSIDSRTILDTGGAEKLLGRGDMLFSPIGTNKPIRIQGAYISVEDVEAVVKFVAQQQPAEYDEAMIPSDEPEDEPKDEPEDEYYQQAVDLVVQQQKASVSMLQRRFRIGYNHAARLVDEMEARGVVGPSEGSKPRRVLKPKVAEP